MTFISPQLELMAIPALPSPDMEALDAPQEEHLFRKCKRKRSMPITPPATLDDPESSRLLDRAVYILSTEATALSYVTRLYQTDRSHGPKRTFESC